MMTKELLERANYLNNKGLTLRGELENLRKVERDKTAFAIFSPDRELVVKLDDLPKTVRDAAVDVLIGGFEREIAQISAAFVELGNEPREGSKAKWVAN